MIKNLTEGKPFNLLLRFSLPILASVLFQQGYTMADSIIVGKFVGTEALAAVGAAHPIVVIFMAIAFGYNIGCSVTISRLFGAGEIAKMKTAVHTALVGIITISLILMAIGFIIARPLLTALNTPENVMENAATYLGIYVAGLCFLFLYNICNGISTALGDSKTPLIFLIFSSIGNILLDLVFILALDMGIAGAAWATFICQAICSVLAFMVLLGRIRRLYCKEKPRLFSGRAMLDISRIAVPSMLQQSFVSVGNLLVQSIINTFGAGAMAGFSSAMRINVLAVGSVGAFGNAMSSFTAQNIGAGKPERVRQGFKAAIGIGVAVALIFTGVLVIFARPVIGLFLDGSENSAEAIETGANFLMTVTPFYAILCFKLVSDGILRGAGSMLFFMVSTFLDLILRVILAFTLSPSLGMMGVCLSWPLGWVTGAVLSTVFYMISQKRDFAPRKRRTG